jgi:IS1 family transposase
MASAEGWKDIETYGKAKEGWLKKFLPLEQGIPKHDVCRRVFTRLKPETVSSCFMEWVRAIKRDIELGEIKPAFSHYDCLEIDEFWTYVGKKQNKVWLIYAYHRESGEIVAYVWGKRDIKTAQKLRERIQWRGINYDRIATDGWDSFLATFGEGSHEVGKKHAVGIAGNNCRLRHRIRRVFQRTCCFSKSLFNHWKAFAMAFFYINHGFV